MQNSIHVIFVHGTFSSSKIWDGVCQELTSHPLVGRTTAFEWSGANDQSERIKAATCLAAFILACKKENPDESICLAGHSHGGNVCFHCVDALPIPCPIDKIITMGTPFFHGVPRKIGLFLSGLYFLISILLSLIIPVFLIYSIGLVWSISKDVSITLFYLLVVGGGVLSLFYRYITNGEEYLQKFVNAEQIRLDGLVAPKFSTRIHSLCFVVKGDEAFVGLKTLESVSGAGTSLAVLHGEAVHEAILIVKNNEMIMVLGSMLFPLLWPSIFILVVIAIIIYAIAVMVQSITRSHRLGFGDLGIWPLMLFDVRVQPLPPKPIAAELRYVAPDVGGLRHSIFYQHPTVITGMVDWLKLSIPGNDEFVGKPDRSRFAKGIGMIYVVVAVLGIPVISTLVILLTL